MLTLDGFIPHVSSPLSSTVYHHSLFCLLDKLTASHSYNHRICLSQFYSLQESLLRKQIWERLSLPISLSVCLYVCPSLSPSRFLLLCLSMPLSLSLSLCLSVFLSFFVSVYPSTSLSLCPCLSDFVSASVSLSH